MHTTARRNREKEQRRQSILKAAEPLFFSKGYDAITMEDIAKGSQLATGTLYLYFRSKEELYFAIVLKGARILNDMLAAAEKSASKGIDKAHAMGMAFYDFHKKYPDYSKAFTFAASLSLDAESRALSEELAGALRLNLLLLRRSIELGIQDGTVRESVDAKKASILLIQATQSVIALPPSLGRMLTADGMTHDELVEYSLGLLRRSIEKKKK
jgi:TetR/AcrR family transcriptional regulator